MKKAALAGVGVLSSYYGYSVCVKPQKSSAIEGDIKDDFKLKLVQVVFRHGARTPISSPSYLPKVTYDPELMQHGDHTYVPYDTKHPDGKAVDVSQTQYKHQEAMCGQLKHGELTSKGAEQMYQLGCSLRQRYISQHKFLSPTYNEEVYVRSTSVKRVVESARCTLAGLFPGQNVPIPIQIAPTDSEILFPNFNRCAYLKSLTVWSWKFPDLIDGMKEERHQIQTAFGIPAETDVHIVLLRDSLASHHAHDLLPPEFDIPEMLKRVDMAAIKVMDHLYAGFHDTRESALRLGIGPLLSLFVDNMKSSISGASETKMCLFSSHDTTVMPLKHALGIEESLWTPYGANITLELYEKQDQDKKKEPFVRVLYQQEEKVIPGCDGAMCSFEQFQNALSKYLITDEEYAEKCNVKSDHLLEKVPKCDGAK